MALFQPTNIIPSSFTVGVVDAAQDIAQISWQVNGKSAMTAYQIDFFQNDAESTPITGAGTGKISDGIPDDGFYGVDRFGQPKMFTWNAGQSWSKYNSGFTNGSQYKFKITQWYSGQDSVISCETTTALKQGKTYYFQEQDGSAIIVFTAPETLTDANNYIYFSYTTGSAWADTRSRIVVGSGYRVADGTAPLGAQRVDGVITKKNLDELFVSQIEPNVFIMRDTPELSIQRSGNAEFSDLQAFPSGSTLPASIGYFVGNYMQAQGAPVREVRWQISTWVNGKEGEILADTGDVDTPTLQYSFNGFFIGSEYAVRCSGKADYQTYGTQDFDSGWKNFTAKIPDDQKQSEYTGNFSVQCLPKENAVLLEWESIEVIPPSFRPDNFNPTASSGSVRLPAKSGETEYSITWKKQGDEAMDFPMPWTAAWKGKVRQQISSIVDFSAIQTDNYANPSQSYLLQYSPDGKYLFYGEIFNGYLKIYDVSINGINLRGYIASSGYIFKSPTAFASSRVPLWDMAFSRNGNLFAVSIANRIFLYSFINGNLELLDSLPVAIENGASALAFSPDGKYLAAGKSNSQRVYSTTNNKLTFLCNLPDLPNEKENIGNTTAIDFNYDGTLICLGTSYGAYLYSFNGQKANLIKELYADEYTTDVVFSKNQNTDMLIVLTLKFGYQYKVSNGDIQRVSVLLNLGTPPAGISRAIAFSPDGAYLLVGGTGVVNWYTVGDSQLTYQGKITTSNWINVMAISWNPTIQQIAIHNDASNAWFNQIIKPVYGYSYFPQGKLFEVQGGGIQLSAVNNILRVQNDSGALANFTYPAEATGTAILITPNAAYAYFYGVEGLISQVSAPITYTQQPVTSVAIFGGDNGATVDSVSVYQGNGSNVLTSYETSNFEPMWNSEDYALYMTANFNGNLEGGTGTASGDGFRIYRQEVGSNILTPIASLKSTETSLKDYGIRSRKAYTYSLYAYDSNQAFMRSVVNDTIVSTCFKSYSLLVCDYDSKNDEYHVRKQYLFALNLSADSESNNNSPTLNKNFTPYPTRMPDTANYISGTLQGLIGAIYTVPALVEQIGGFKHTAKPSTMDYFDSVDLEKELYDLSVAPYQLFLRDMAGHLRMVTTSNHIAMKPDLKKRQIPKTMSFPWVEIGDASDVTIIQTPSDYGWNNDNQVLDVRLDVDPTTGVLSATYPRPYNGTKFYLTGINKEILGAETPTGITPAQFGLSKTTSVPDDGTLTATAIVNTEEGD